MTHRRVVRTGRGIASGGFRHRSEKGILRTNVNPEPQQQPEYTPNAAQPQAYPNQPQAPQYAPQYQQQPGYAPYPPQANPADTGSFGWAVLGFFIPVVGLIL
ncbi:hypothetical protein [Bifidobacterium callitrichos]|uniref:Uncharacterized protein n=1 Tax=Bifidobacterium callitrichos DSM 23973 TaxID=1437609 RepID=A0A087A5W7_9BIFI|nr:hypothetical protein [Bifidobacterium callitrichos]KFI54167.1 hypothetical protein BCAL_2270 [Bifidobacterium callitrichos DSM 23973]